MSGGIFGSTGHKQNIPVKTDAVQLQLQECIVNEESKEFIEIEVKIYHFYRQ